MAQGRRGAQDALQDSGTGALAKYRSLMVGAAGFGAFLRYEFVTSVFGPWPGALGYWLRSKFYPGLFRRCGRRVIFGRNLSIRHPGRISLGDRVVLSDGVLLDGKGSTPDGGIVVGDGAFIGLGSMITTTDGRIELAAGCNVGAYCRIGTFGRTRIGEKALLAAWVYVVGAGHESARTDVPILDQPYTHRGGAQIGDGAWLGARATVMDGVTVGAHAIVGAHAVVTKDLPDYSISMGIPARVTGSRRTPPPD